MEITEHDDVESRGRLAPHEVPLAMASVLCACRAVRRRTRELTAAGGGVQRLIRRVRRAKMLRRALFVMMAAHFTSYDMVMMAPVVHALPEMLEPWRELSNAEFTHVTRFGIARFLVGWECSRVGRLAFLTRF